MSTYVHGCVFARVLACARVHVRSMRGKRGVKLEIIYAAQLVDTAVWYSINDPLCWETLLLLRSLWTKRSNIMCGLCLWPAGEHRGSS